MQNKTKLTHLQSYATVLLGLITISRSQIGIMDIDLWLWCLIFGVQYTIWSQLLFNSSQQYPNSMLCSDELRHPVSHVYVGRCTRTAGCATPPAHLPRSLRVFLGTHLMVARQHFRVRTLKKGRKGVRPCEFALDRPLRPWPPFTTYVWWRSAEGTHGCLVWME